MSYLDIIKNELNLVNEKSLNSLIDEMKVLSTADEIGSFVETYKDPTSSSTPVPNEIFNNNLASITEFEQKTDCQTGQCLTEDVTKSLYREDYGTQTYYQVMFDNAHEFDHFKIDASNFTNDAHIALSKSSGETTIEWEIVFGGWAGTGSAIRIMFKILLASVIELSLHISIFLEESNISNLKRVNC